MTAADDPLRSDLAESDYVPAQYVLSAVVYAERGDEILLLKRAVGTTCASILLHVRTDLDRYLAKLA